MKSIKLNNPDDNSKSDDLYEGDLLRLQNLGVQTLIYWYKEGTHDDDDGYALVQIGGLWHGTSLGWCPCCGTGPTDSLVETIQEEEPKTLDQLYQKEVRYWKNTKGFGAAFMAALPLT
jgi:hypothetical protein